MIRLTVRGNPKKKVWVGKCRGCDSEYEAEESDLVGAIQDPLPGEHGSRFASKPCQVCDGAITFTPKQ